MDEIKALTQMGFELNPDCDDQPDENTVMTTIFGWQFTIEYQSVCLFKGGLWLSYTPSDAIDYDDFAAKIRQQLKATKPVNKNRQLSLF